MRREFQVQIKYSVGFPYFILGGTEMKEKLFAQFARENNGKRAKISIDDDISYDMRKFFEGAVAPYFFFQSEVAYSSVKEGREALKLEFGRKRYQKTINGQTQIISVSTTEYNKMQFQALLDNIQSYFMENGFLYPDSEDFKKWRDSSPLIGEIYPPLKKIMEAWDKRNGKVINS
jgi:hypothetical protein